MDELVVCLCIDEFFFYLGVGYYGFVFFMVISLWNSVFVVFLFNVSSNFSLGFAGVGGVLSF